MLSQHLKLIDKLEAKCDRILESYASAGMHCARDVYRQHHKALSNYQSVQSMLFDCAAYQASHPTYPTINYLGDS